MYKLFLTIRYLTRKAIVVFPILVVWLCVAMLIIVTSIMGGFVDRVRQANRELMGDVIVESQSRAGWPRYEELRAELGALRAPDGRALIEVSTPVVRAYGLFNVGRANAPVQVIGIDPAGRAAVSSFLNSLYRQHVAPTQAAEDLAVGSFPATGTQLRERAAEQIKAADEELVRLEARRADIDAGRKVSASGFNWVWLLLGFPMLLAEWLIVALTRDGVRQWRMFRWGFPLGVSVILLGLAALPLVPHTPTARDREVLDDAFQQNGQRGNRAIRTQQLAMTLPAAGTYKSARELKDALVPRTPSFEAYPPTATMPGDEARPGVIVGVDLGLYERDRRGNYDRPPFRDYVTGTVTVAPISRDGRLLSALNAQVQQVRIVDDSYSKVFDVDSTYVYTPFEVAQHLALMHQQTREDDGSVVPARISELQIKVRNGDDEEALQAAKRQIEGALARVQNRFRADFDTTGRMQVQTWDEKQARYISAVVNEKRMITFILLLMSVVVLVVIFLIFYIIVRDKTRDIGIIKAVGGSESGVMLIFQLYGGVIGVLGGVMGVVTGVAFVLHTNEIHEWIFQTFGVLIWNRSVYLFDRIPDQVNPWEVLLYFAVAVVAGLLGALIPALVAGFQNPVRALRHE